MAATKKSANRGRGGQLRSERATQVTEANKRAQESNASKRSERQAAESQQQAQQEAANDMPRENDMVSIDIDGVPQELRTTPMSESLRGLVTAGMQGRSGRLSRYEDDPVSGERFAVVEGPDFTQRVPVATLRAVGQAGKQTGKPGGQGRGVRLDGTKSRSRKAAAKKGKKAAAKRTRSRSAKSEEQAGGEVE